MKRSLLAVLVVLSTALALAAPTLIARVLTVTPVQAAIVDRQLRPGATVTVVNTGADGRQVSRFDADGAALTAHPDLAVVAGHTYLLRPHSAATTGCYGWEYDDAGPYPPGIESYSTDGDASFTDEAGRDLKFSTDVSATAVFVPDGVPAGFTRCAGEAERCVFTGTRMTANGSGTAAGSYRFRPATGESTVNRGVRRRPDPRRGQGLLPRLTWPKPYETLQTSRRQV